VPVPMARRLVLIPVLPRVTVSDAENFFASVWSASALRMDLGKNHAAPGTDGPNEEFAPTHGVPPARDVVSGYINPRRVHRTECFFRHSNCLRNSASCWRISASSWRSCETSFSKRDTRSSLAAAGLEVASVAGEGASATPPVGSPENKWM
jgi:hypothetical protein